MTLTKNDLKSGWAQSLEQKYCKDAFPAMPNSACLPKIYSPNPYTSEHIKSLIHLILKNPREKKSHSLGNKYLYGVKVTQGSEFG